MIPPRGNERGAVGADFECQMTVMGPCDGPVSSNNRDQPATEARSCEPCGEHLPSVDETASSHNVSDSLRGVNYDQEGEGWLHSCVREIWQEPRWPLQDEGRSEKAPATGGVL